jgi:hypothetical protein
MNLVALITLTVLVLELSVGLWFLSIAFFGRWTDDPPTRFCRGWVGAIGLFAVPGSCAGIALILGDHGSGGVLTVLVTFALNLIVQPFAVLFSWTAIRKIALGVQGRVAYAWREVPAEQLTDLLPAARRSFSRHCVFQGLAMLPTGIGLSIGCGWPLMQSFRAWLALIW